jgi:hypothetical protein
MRPIVWLASYPKSGNTWVRTLLANYLAPGDEPVDINDLSDMSRSAGERRSFDDWVGVEASALDQAVVDRLRPAVYRHMAAEAENDLFIKVHDAWRCDDRGGALFPPSVTAAVVYIVRNPLDMAVSCAHHWGVEMEQAVERICDPAYCVANSDSKLADQLRQVLGSWSGHVGSWLDESALPCHVVRYEDLHRDPERALARIVRACGLPYDRARVGRAVEFSDFAELQGQERARGFRERPLAARGSFFRRGEVDCWRDELPEAPAARLAACHRATMIRFGYLGSN